MADGTRRDEEDAQPPKNISIPHYRSIRHWRQTAEGHVIRVARRVAVNRTRIDGCTSVARRVRRELSRELTRARRRGSFERAGRRGDRACRGDTYVRSVCI
jgi:hypothetical protein